MLYNEATGITEVTASVFSQVFFRVICPEIAFYCILLLDHLQESIECVLPKELLTFAGTVVIIGALVSGSLLLADSHSAS